MIVLVVGTRPEAIKLAPVAQALAARGLAPRLLLTGQHPDLDLRAFGLAACAATALGCPGIEDPCAHAAQVARRAAPLLNEAELVVVQGDTSSALGGALAASMAGIPLAHVEAGLRSHDPANPWPEEEFRAAIDHEADLLFAPTELSAANLRREQVRGEVHVTGNSGIDALLAQAATLSTERPPAAGRARLLVTCHRRESWGRGLESIAAALREIAGEGLAAIEFVLHPNPNVAGQMRRLISGVGGLSLAPPCDHRTMLARMLAADLILSDSGGMQEEAPALGIPLLVLRERTERPEGIASGNIQLVGTDSGRILAAVRRLLGGPGLLAAMARPALPYGDGRAAERIAHVVEEWLGAREDESLMPAAE